MNVELKLWLKDLVSGSLRKMETTTRAAFGGIDRSMNATQKQLNSMGQSVDSLNKRLDELRKQRDISIDTRAIRDANREIERLERQVDRVQNMGRRRQGGGGVTGSMAMGAFVGNLAAQGAMMAAGAVTRQVSGALNGGLEAGAMQEQYKVLVGEMEGAKLFADIKKYVAESVFGPELYENGRTLMAFGGQAKEVMGTMKMLGDVAMGDKEKMDLLTLAFAQTQSAGRLMGQDLLQYVNAGFNPLMVLAEKTGQSFESLKEQMSEGKISADMVKQAFVLATGEGGKFHGMLKKMADTPFGKLQAMQGSIADAKTGLGMGLAPAISKLLDGLKPMVDGLPRVMDRLVPVMDRAFTRINDMLPTLSEFGTAAMGIIKPIGDFILSDGMGALTKSVLGLSKDILTGLAPVVRSAAKGLSELAGVVGGVVEKMRGLGGVIGKAYDFMNAGSLGVRKDAQKADLLRDMNSKANDLFRRERLRMASKFDFGVSKTAVGAATMATAAPTSTAQRDAITGGGKKIININLNQPLVKEQVFHVGSMQEAVSVGLNEFRELYLRVLQGANAAL